jgi:hypothetical protein
MLVKKMKIISCFLFMVILPYLLDDTGHPNRGIGDRAYVCLSLFHSVAPIRPDNRESGSGRRGLVTGIVTFAIGKGQALDPALGEIFVLGLSLFLPFFVLPV